MRDKGAGRQGSRTMSTVHTPYGTVLLCIFAMYAVLCVYVLCAEYAVRGVLEQESTPGWMRHWTVQCLSGQKYIGTNPISIDGVYMCTCRMTWAAAQFFKLFYILYTPMDM